MIFKEYMYFSPENKLDHPFFQKSFEISENCGTRALPVCVITFLVKNVFYYLLQRAQWTVMTKGSTDQSLNVQNALFFADIQDFSQYKH